MSSIDRTVREVAADLSAFADAATQVQTRLVGRVLEVEWQQRGDTRRDKFNIYPDGGVARDTAFGGQPYRAFLAGDEMADLRRTARVIRRIRPLDPFYVDSEAIQDGDRGTAIDLLRKSVERPTVDNTNLVFLTAEAGVGKTAALQRLVTQQAELFGSGEADFLFLYVDAQGRALARFNEALALELDDLSAPMGYHAVAALARHGLLIPIVDGFDELIGSKGSYDDAFSSLTDFVDDLHGRGAIIASARSVYYEREFVRRADQGLEHARYWTQQTITVLPWQTEQYSAFIEKRISGEVTSGAERSRLASQVDRVFSTENAALRAKPLFVTRVVDLILKDRGDALIQSDDLLDEMVRLYLAREVEEKLQYRLGGSVLSERQLRDFLNLLAEEMWQLETRELNARTVTELADFFSDVSELPPEAQEILKERAPDLAFLMPGFKRGTIRFEHEMFFGWFLAISLANTLQQDPPSLRTLLGRSVLPDEAGRSTAVRMNPRTEEEVEAALRSLRAVTERAGPHVEQVRDNAGLLVAHLLKLATDYKVVLHDLVLDRVNFAGVSLADVVMENATLTSVLFRGTDLTRARILQSKGTECRFEAPLVDPESTRLEVSGLDAHRDFLGMEIVTREEQRTVFDPREIVEILVRVGALPQTSAASVRRVSADRLNLLNMLIRAYSRANPICLDDDLHRPMVTAPEWPGVSSALISSGVVTEEFRATSGSKKRWLRRQFRPDQIMGGLDPKADVPPEVKRFWDELEGEA